MSASLNLRLYLQEFQRETNMEDRCLIKNDVTEVKNSLKYVLVNSFLEIKNIFTKDYNATGFVFAFCTVDW